MIAPESLALFVALLCGHLLGDFVMQNGKIAERKKKEDLWLALHVGIVTLISWLLVGDWRAWEVPLLLFGMHIGLDRLKTFLGGIEKLRGRGEWLFLGDQAAHLISLIMLTAIVTMIRQPQSMWFALWRRESIDWMVILSGVIIAVRVGRFVIAERMRPWLKALEEQDMAQIRSDGVMATTPNDGPRGLAAAGSTIGQLERLLIFIFVLGNQYAAIGFLIAAKSIFRFSESQKDQKWAEYLLIGSLWSLAFGLAAGLATIGSLQIVGRIIP